MNMPWKKNTDSHTSSAKVVDGNLILSLPDAINPIVWRMELGSVKASALEVRSHANDGTFLLTLKTPKGDVHDIAPYATRESAVGALMRVSSALQSAEGKIAPVSTATGGEAAGGYTAAARPAVPAGTVLKWLLAFAGVILLVILFAYLSSLAPTTPSGPDGVPASGYGAEDNAESGVPESADRMLRGF